MLARTPLERLRPGDSFISNDPYKAGSSHVPDMVAVTPCFHDGSVVGFGVSVAHKADVGGLVPGSSGAGAREIFHDGLLLPPVRFQSADGIDRDVEAIIANNSRIPDIVLGDLRAQVGATRIGGERLAALCDEYGADTVRAVMASLMDLARRRLSTEIARWSDGESEAEGFLDHDGAQKDKPVRIHVRATKAGERLVLDFSGSSAQTVGPVNLVTSTAQAVSMLAVLATSDPTIPVNDGIAQAVEFVIPPGLVVSPRHPATVNHYFPTAHLTYNVVLAALGRLNKARAVAPSGLGSGAISIGYRTARTGKPAVLYELLNTSLGGTATHDGTPIVMAMCHFTPGTPVEIIESEYPIRVRAFELVADFGRRRAPARRHGLRARVRDAGRQHAHRALGQSSLRRLGPRGRIAAARLARGAQSGPNRRRGIGADRDARLEGRRRDPLRAQRRRRLWRALRAQRRGGAQRRRRRLCQRGSGGEGVWEVAAAMPYVASPCV